MKITVTSTSGESILPVAHVAANIAKVTAHIVWVEHQGITLAADEDPSQTVHTWHNRFAAAHGQEPVR